MVDQTVKLPPACTWSGAANSSNCWRTQKTMRLVLPLVILLIFVILYLTYNDLMDAVLMMMAVPEALVCGVFLLLWLLRRTIGASPSGWGSSLASAWPRRRASSCWFTCAKRSSSRGGLAKIASLDELRETVVEGGRPPPAAEAAHRGRRDHRLGPDALAGGVGHEVLSAMAAPVLGGLLFSDEVVDLFIPVRFYWVRRRRWLKLHTERMKAER